jgi:hypothetical protein
MTDFEKIRRHLHDVSPYEDFDSRTIPLDLHGFGQNAQLFNDLTRELKPNLIVEVGTWYGKSAATWGQAVIQSNAAENKRGGVLCIDTWLGAREMWEHHGGGASAWWSRSKVPTSELAISHGRLMMKNGYPQFYYQFLANMVHLGLKDVIVPFPTTSAIGGRFLRGHGYTAEIIYIDGSHEYEDVSGDLSLYWDSLASGGALVGDDIWIDDVRRAVFEFANNRGLKVNDAHPCWFIRKP